MPTEVSERPEPAKTKSRRPRVFVAIPCGAFYSVQADMLRELFASAEIDAYIAEDSPDTKGLWDSISVQIDGADAFLADISSGSPNILLEVGYAIARKPIGAIGLFISDQVDVPSDLRWVVAQVYSSLASFRATLASWIERTLPVSRASAPLAPTPTEVFAEDFMSEDLFLRRWATPPGCSYFLTAEGLRFSNAHFPILTTPLAIMGDCEFEFQGRIDSEQLGWALKGTKGFTDLLPSFCVMFALNIRGELTPHVWNARHPHPQTHYQVFSRTVLPPNVRPRLGVWARFVTHVKGNMYEIEIDGNSVFRADLSLGEFALLYSDRESIQGQVGFRCHPGEQATVRSVRVRALD